MSVSVDVVVRVCVDVNVVGGAVIVPVVGDVVIGGPLVPVDVETAPVAEFEELELTQPGRVRRALIISLAAVILFPN